MHGKVSFHILKKYIWHIKIYVSTFLFSKGFYTVVIYFYLNKVWVLVHPWLEM